MSRRGAIRMFSGLKKPLAILAALARSSKGNILPMTAAAIFILAGMIGGGIDISRAYMVKNRLQNACDAAALAARKAADTSKPWIDTVNNPPVDNAAARNQAVSFFNTNFDKDTEGASAANFVSESSDNGSTINGTATATLPTVVMNLFGYKQTNLSVTCTASMGVGNSHVMFVLDNTGSMAWTPDGYTTYDATKSRMYALQQAMKAFYTTVETSMGGSNSRVRYGFVPYSSSVNVGSVLMNLDPSYIADSASYDTREPVNWTPVGGQYTKDTDDPTWTKTTTGSWKSYTGDTTHYSSSSSCNSAKPASGNPNNDDDWVAAGSITYNTTSRSFDPDKVRMVDATGTTQPFSLNEYQCASSGSGKNKYYYIQIRTDTRSKSSKVYQDNDPVEVTTAGATFSDWLYKPRTLDTSGYKAGNSVPLLLTTTVINQTCTTDWRGRKTCSGGTTVTANVTSDVWNGCIMERDTLPEASFSFESLEEGISPYTHDLDIDEAPTDDATKWRPLWPDATYGRPSYQPSVSGDSNDAGSYTYCPHQAQTFAEMDQDAFNNYVNSMSPVGSTYHDIGLLWGARLSSPTGIFADNVNETPDNGGSVSRHLILMTDGELEPSLTVNSAYGIEELDRRITGDGATDQYDRHRERYLAICEAIKARGIRLWVIAFGSGVTLSDDLVACASPDSAFKADNSTELYNNFQEIAKQVGELRITQ